MILGQEPQRLVVPHPAVLDVVGIHPGLVAEPVLAEQPLLVEVDRRDPAVLVVDGTHIKRRVFPVRRPARLPDLHATFLWRFEAFLGFLPVLALFDKVFDGRASDVCQWVVPDARQVAETPR